MEKETKTSKGKREKNVISPFLSSICSTKLHLLLSSLASLPYSFYAHSPPFTSPRLRFSPGVSRINTCTSLFSCFPSLYPPCPSSFVALHLRSTPLSQKLKFSHIFAKCFAKRIINISSQAHKPFNCI